MHALLYLYSICVITHNKTLHASHNAMMCMMNSMSSTHYRHILISVHMRWHACQHVEVEVSCISMHARYYLGTVDAADEDDVALVSASYSAPRA